MGTLRAVIFDMNGVLSQDEGLHQAATERALGDINIPLTPDEYKRMFAGRPDREAFEELQQHAKRELDVPALVAAKTVAYQKLAAERLQSYPGVREALEAIRDAALPMAVVTSAPREEAKMVLNKLGFLNFFRVLLTEEDVKKGKPAPDGYLLGVQRLGVVVHDCVVIEDAPKGVAAARAGNIRCLAVTNTHTRHELSAADKVVDALDAGIVFTLRGMFA